MLYECCRLRGNPKELIHRTIHEFDWFCQKLILDKNKIIKDKYVPLTDDALIEKIKNFRYQEEFLRELVSLYYEYCKLIYDFDANKNDLANIL